MYGLSALLIAKIQELTTGLLFDHKPTGEKKAAEVVDAFLPQLARDWQEGQEYPLIRVAHYKGAFLSQGSEYRVVVLAGIYTAGDIPAGTADIKQLAAAIGSIAKARLLGKYRLETPIEYHFGDNDRGAEGIQPHPYHFVTFYLNFTSA